MKMPAYSHEEELKRAERVAYLIAGHLSGSLTEEEGEELDDWITESDENLELFENLTDEENIERAMETYLEKERRKAEALGRVKQKIRNRNRPGINSLRTWLVAASVIAVMAVAGWLWYRSGGDVPAPVATETKPSDVLPGSDKAILTLADGRNLILDDGPGGLLASEGGVQISRTDEGEISYQGTDNDMHYNRITTPRGGQYKLVLGDGSRVWLNAESSIKFPAAFGSNKREVETTGEVYFEVASQKVSSPDGGSAKLPFVVHVNGMEVSVLGTHFNVNSYGDEGGVKTTLLEGSVMVRKGDQSRLLQPGEEAFVNTQIQVRKVEAENAVAWKDGKFLFRDATIQSVGEQIKRWYDVDVVYKGNVSALFSTESERDVPLSFLLESLEGTGKVHFQMKNRTLIIQP